MMSKDEVKAEMVRNIDIIRGLRHGLRVADVAFSMNADSAAITSAFTELVAEGILRVVRKTGRVNVYEAV